VKLRLPQWATFVADKEQTLTNLTENHQSQVDAMADCKQKMNEFLAARVQLANV
jgi:hypothetical protein